MAPSDRLSILPAELRNQIYELILTPDNDNNNKEINVEQESLKARTGLLQTSSRIRSEASSIFYDSNTFVLDIVIGGANPGLKWFEAIGTTAARSIRRIEVNVSYPPNHTHATDTDECGISQFDMEHAASYIDALVAAGVNLGGLNIRVSAPPSPPSPRYFLRSNSRRRYDPDDIWKPIRVPASCVLQGALNRRTWEQIWADGEREERARGQ